MVSIHQHYVKDIQPYDARVALEDKSVGGSSDSPFLGRKASALWACLLLIFYLQLAHEDNTCRRMIGEAHVYLPPQHSFSTAKQAVAQTPMESWLEGTKPPQFPFPFSPRGRRSHCTEAVMEERTMQWVVQGWVLSRRCQLGVKDMHSLYTMYPSVFSGESPCLQQEGFLTQTNTIVKVRHTFP